MWASAVPLARDAVSGLVTGVILMVGLLAMVLTEVDSLWVIVGAALVSLAAALGQSVLALQMLR
jgi:chromate transporter